MVHGGVIASLIDSSCACAAFSLIYPNGYVTTIDLQVEFLIPVSKGRLLAKAKCILIIISLDIYYIFILRLCIKVINQLTNFFYVLLLRKTNFIVLF